MGAAKAASSNSPLAGSTDQVLNQEPSIAPSEVLSLLHGSREARTRGWSRQNRGQASPALAGEAVSSAAAADLEHIGPSPVLLSASRIEAGEPQANPGGGQPSTAEREPLREGSQPPTRDRTGSEAPPGVNSSDESMSWAGASAERSSVGPDPGLAAHEQLSAGEILETGSSVPAEQGQSRHEVTETVPALVHPSAGKAVGLVLPVDFPSAVASTSQASALHASQPLQSPQPPSNEGTSACKSVAKAGSISESLPVEKATNLETKISRMTNIASARPALECPSPLVSQQPVVTETLEKEASSSTLRSSPDVDTSLPPGTWFIPEQLKQGVGMPDTEQVWPPRETSA